MAKAKKTQVTIVNGRYMYQSFRKDCEQLFSSHFPIDHPDWEMKMTPILIFEEGNFHTTKKVSQLQNFKPTSVCFAVWPGQWRSDIFTFTIADWIKYNENRT